MSKRQKYSTYSTIIVENSSDSFRFYTLRRSHPAQYGETFDWSANLIAQRFRAPEGGYILSFLREERLGEKGGTPFG